MTYYIYLTTNTINNKKYIGQHRGEINDSYLGSGVALQEAIAKYGKENFKKEILEECQEKELNEKEKYWIEYYNAYRSDDFYNLAEGGQEGDGWKTANRWMKEHPEEAKKIYQQNIEKLRKWEKENPELAKQNVQYAIEGAKRWKEENRDKVLKHMEKVNEAKEKWQLEHQEEHLKQIEEWRKKGTEANSKKVRCVTTGEEFCSISEAARAYNLAQPNISKVLKGERKSCGKLDDGTKLTWEWC